MNLYLYLNHDGDDDDKVSRFHIASQLYLYLYLYLYHDDDDDDKVGRFHIARQPPTAANLNIQSSISLSIDIVLKFEYPIFAIYTI